MALPSPRRSRRAAAPAVRPTGVALDAPLVAASAALRAEDLWGAVLQALRERVPHSSISLLLPDITSVASPEALEALRRRFRGYVLSPGVMASRNYLRHHPGAQIYTYSEILQVDPTASERRETEGDEHWREFANLAFWSRRGQLRAILTVRRRPEHGSFNADEFEFFRVLYPVVHGALERLERLEREQAISRCFELFLRALPVASLFVGEDGDLLFANPAAFDLCALWNFGPRQAASFNTRACFELPAAVAQAVQRLAEARDEAAGAREIPREARVQHPRIPGLTATIRAVDTGPRGSPGRRDYIVCLAYADRFGNADVGEASARDAVLQLLSPAEQRIALHAADGLSNKEIAAREGKTLTTVEWTLHEIYRKVRVNGRVQLVRSLLGA